MAEMDSSIELYPQACADAICRQPYWPQQNSGMKHGKVLECPAVIARSGMQDCRLPDRRNRGEESGASFTAIAESMLYANK
jgi:hypothetical protein